MGKAFMISFEEAKELILKEIPLAKIENYEVSASRGLIAAVSILSPIDSPPFNQAAVDGYAFRIKDLKKFRSLKICGESTAGKIFDGKSESGSCIRIFTGAAVPDSLDTVVMQEHVTVRKDEMIPDDGNITRGSNIRYRGSQIRKREIAIPKFERITSGSIGLLYSLGITTIRCFKKPAIAVIVTGNELIAPGKDLQEGTIYESNSFMLKSVLNEHGFEDISIFHAADNLQNTIDIFKEASKEHDFVLFTGGISVGDYDFVGKALSNQKVQAVFYKVKQKPGKPIYFGMKSKKAIFGLPGNPASVMVCFYEYVLPALYRSMGYPTPFAKEMLLPVNGKYSKKSGMVHFLRAYTDLQTVTILEGQESYKLLSFCKANCIVVIDEEVVEVREGDIVRVQMVNHLN
ncbi:MAG: molybdopterin molybdotransferase MoeA [Bacteroidetes bacterium]|nr:molybdopterin molybdotransferase MoeA [Bacteroidota bacterium]